MNFFFSTCEAQKFNYDHCNETEVKRPFRSFLDEKVFTGEITEKDIRARIVFNLFVRNLIYFLEMILKENTT